MLRAEMVHSPKLSHCIEVLCHQGCSAVRGYITRLEEGQSVPHAEDLSYSEKQVLLRELKTVMAVYDARED